MTQSFTVVSGHVGPDHPTSSVNWDAVATQGGTVVLLMAVATLDAITRRLVAAGMDPSTPAVTPDLRPMLLAVRAEHKRLIHRRRLDRFTQDRQRGDIAWR